MTEAHETDQLASFWQADEVPDEIIRAAIHALRQQQYQMAYESAVKTPIIERPLLP